MNPLIGNFLHPWRLMGIDRMHFSQHRDAIPYNTLIYNNNVAHFGIEGHRKHINLRYLVVRRPAFLFLFITRVFFNSLTSRHVVYLVVQVVEIECHKLFFLSALATR